MRIQIQECIKAELQVDDMQNVVPVVYHELYNLKLLPYTMSTRQYMMQDKSARVHAMLQSM